MSEYFKFLPADTGAYLYARGMHDTRILLSEQLRSDVMQARPRGNFFAERFLNQWQQENQVEIVAGTGNRFVDRDKFEHFAKSFKADQIIPRDQFKNDADYIRGNAQELMKKFMHSRELRRISTENMHSSKGSLFNIESGFAPIGNYFRQLGPQEQELFTEIAAEFLAHKIGLNTLAKDDLSTREKRAITQAEYEVIGSNFKLQEKILRASGLDFSVPGFTVQRDNYEIGPLLSLAEGFAAAYEKVHDRNIDLVVQKEKEQHLVYQQSKPDAPFHKYQDLQSVLHYQDQMKSSEAIMNIPHVLSHNGDLFLKASQEHEQAKQQLSSLALNLEKQQSYYGATIEDPLTGKQEHFSAAFLPSRTETLDNRNERDSIMALEKYRQEHSIASGDNRMLSVAALNLAKIPYDPSKVLSIKDTHGMQFDLISPHFVPSLKLAPPEVSNIAKFEQFLNYKALHPQVDQPQVDTKLVASSLQDGNKTQQIQNICASMADFSVTHNNSKIEYQSPDEQRLTSAIAGYLLSNKFVPTDSWAMTKQAAAILSQVPENERFDLFNSAHAKAEQVSEHLAKPYKEMLLEQYQKPSLIEQAKEFLQTNVFDKAKDLMQTIKEHFKSQEQVRTQPTKYDLTR